MKMTCEKGNLLLINGKNEHFVMMCGVRAKLGKLKFN
jgi:hypothetical protein